jgi:serine/threonine protein kinase
MRHDNDISNEKLLNIIQVNTKNSISESENKKEIMNTNHVIQNNISKNFNVIKYLGEGIQGKLYLLNDISKNKFICKKIINVHPKSNKYNQIKFELDILKYLSSNRSVKPYVNPCINNFTESSNIYTIFPILDSIPLYRFKKHLDTISFKNRQFIIKKLIKNILHGISNIHKLNISHQNINESNILISLREEEKGKNIDIKFTEFGLGCGTYKIPKDDIYNIKNNNELYKKCIINNDHKLIKTDFNKLKHSNYLQNSILKDNWKIGCILLNILFPKLNINTEEYNSDFENNYIKNIENAIRTLKYENDILNYIDIILKYYIVEPKNRKNSKYILDKILLYEKYEE